MTAEAEVLAAENAWLQAHRVLDLEALDRLMHPDYRSIRPDGSVWDKARTLRSYREDGRHWDLAEISELDIRVYGDLGLVIGRWRAQGINSGRPFDYSARYFSLWSKDDIGLWRLMHDQSQEIHATSTD